MNQLQLPAYKVSAVFSIFETSVKKSPKFVYKCDWILLYIVFKHIGSTSE